MTGAVPAEVQMPPAGVIGLPWLMLSATTASFDPSADDAMDLKFRDVPTPVLSVQVAPESIEVQIWPKSTTAASLLPSSEEVIDLQDLIVDIPVVPPLRCTQLVPESAEVQISPPSTTAASLLPSAEAVTDAQY